MTVTIMKKTKNLKTRVGIFKNMGGNVPSGNFLGWNFPGGNFSGGVWWVGIFQVGVFLIPFYIFHQFIQFWYAIVSRKSNATT